MGWILERSFGSVDSKDGSDEDSSDEYGSDSEESSIVAQRKIKARRGPQFL